MTRLDHFGAQSNTPFDISSGKCFDKYVVALVSDSSNPSGEKTKNIGEIGCNIQF